MTRIGFVTCVGLGRACMEAVLHDGGSFALAVTLEDEVSATKSGRVALDDLAEAHGIPLVKVRNINDADAVQALRDADLDWLMIIGWSQIAKAEVLTSSRHGVLGMHPTLLPKGRGRASIPWAILKGLPETGVTLFKLDEGVDTGPIAAQRTIPITPRETASTLYEKVSTAHVDLIREVWPKLQVGNISLRTQDASKATTWPGRRPEDGEFAPETMTTIEVDCHVRALTRPYPGAFTKRDDGTVLRVWDGHPAMPHDSDPQDAENSVIKTLDGSYIATDLDIEGHS